MIQLACPNVDMKLIRKCIETRLCELGELEPDQFPVTERPLIKGGKHVGIYFCLHGPRSVKITAICDLVCNTVIFYGSDGIRTERESLVALAG